MEFEFSRWSLSILNFGYFGAFHFGLTLLCVRLRLKTMLVAIMAFWLSALITSMFDPQGIMFSCRYSIVNSDIGEWRVKCPPSVFAFSFAIVSLVLVDVKTAIFNFWAKGWRVNLGVALLVLFFSAFLQSVPFQQATRDYYGKGPVEGHPAQLILFLFFGFGIYLIASAVGKKQIPKDDMTNS